MKLLPLLLLAPALAHAGSWFDYEAGIGFSRYDVQHDGTWYQAGMPHRLSTNNVAFMVGITGDVWRGPRFGLAYHLDYVFLGNASASCACTEWDADYSLKERRQINPNAPHATFRGHGNAQGIAATLEPYVHYGRWRFGIEGGVFASRPQWDETISADVEGVLHSHTTNGVQFGPVVGVSAGNGPFSVSFRHYSLPTRFDSRHFPSLLTGANVVMLTYKW